MDLQMTGFEAARAIRTRETDSRIPIVAVTAAGAQKREECLAAGMDGFLTQPFRASGLVGAMKCQLVSKS